ncbi:sensor domain-containing diguanylate cyclase [Shewanella sp. NR704-98]|uniref:Sensor domain-containing diguanylate cyclase n=1 Tax=Shewanella nanhaiensis TaxID=2864872 RepID=A0ABS7DY14_9GAMM|nr:sensor domain-containing diguanylate cyclase [Shewanella nanhaiensis]
MTHYRNRSLLDLEIDEVNWQRWQRLVNVIAEIFNAPASYINQANQKGIQILVASQKTETIYKPGSSTSGGDIYCDYVATHAKELYVKDARLDPQWLANPEFTRDKYLSYLGLPILWSDGSVFGTLCLFDTQVTDYPASFINALRVIKEVIETDLCYLETHKQLLTLSYTDPLTQIYNRLGFTEILHNTQDLAKRLNRQLILLFFDLDEFKAANDNLGHDVGDLMLTTFASQLKASSRGSDLVARWGGDEFVVVLHAESENSIEIFISRLDQTLNQDSHQPQINIPKIKYSFGYVIITPDDKRDLTSLLAIADKKMYQNKQGKKHL